jgi:GIY-YIG catalytic domain
MNRKELFPGRSLDFTNPEDVELGHKQADYFRRIGITPGEYPEDSLMREMGPEPEVTLEKVRKLLKQIKDCPIEALPRIAIDKPDFGRNLPVSTSAIYYLVHAHKGILYIGKAKSLNARWVYGNPGWGGDFVQQHHRLSDALKLKNVWLYWWEVPKELLTILESLLIQWHRPPWNSHTS